MDGYTYAAQCADYLYACREDPRFFAATVFETDYAAGEWQSFDTEPARNELVNATQGIWANPWYGGASGASTSVIYMPLVDG